MLRLTISKEWDSSPVPHHINDLGRDISIQRLSHINSEDQVLQRPDIRLTILNCCRISRLLTSVRSTRMPGRSVITVNSASHSVFEDTDPRKYTMEPAGHVTVIASPSKAALSDPHLCEPLTILVAPFIVV